MRKAANKSDWKDGFLFLGNALVLDFVNTRPVQDGEPTELLPEFGAVLRWFQAAELLNSEQVARIERQWERTTEAKKATEVMKELRERWREEILAWEGGRAIHRQTLDELNGLMGMHPMLTRLAKSQTVYSTKLWFEVREPADLLAPLAHSAATLLATGDRKRVRKCANCVLHFHDTSKKVPVAGAACSCAAIALRLRRTQLGSVKNGKTTATRREFRWSQSGGFPNRTANRVLR